MSQRHYAVLGSEFNLPKAYVPKKKHATAISEHRQMAVADALGAERRQAIKAAAREAAQKIMEDFMVEHLSKKGIHLEWEGRR